LHDHVATTRLKQSPMDISRRYCTPQHTYTSHCSPPDANTDSAPSQDAHTIIRRSSRLAHKPRQTHADDLHYPEGKPMTRFEKEIARLNLEAFPASLYAQVDDIVVWSLFASKRRHTARQALKPAASSSLHQSLVTNERALAIHERCRSIFHDPTRDRCETAARDLVGQFPDLFSAIHTPIIAQ
jgi:hypothetical protein